MSKDDGFSVMDVSTAILDDQKFRKLARYAPDHVGEAVTGYLAVLAMSWREGERVCIEDAWPPYMAVDRLAIEALVHVQLLDKRGRVTPRAWREWFTRAFERRAKQRADWREWQRRKREGHGGVMADAAGSPA